MVSSVVASRLPSARRAHSLVRLCLFSRTATITCFRACWTILSVGPASVSATVCSRAAVACLPERSAAESICCSCSRPDLSRDGLWEALSYLVVVDIRATVRASEEGIAFGLGLAMGAGLADNGAALRAPKADLAHGFNVSHVLQRFLHRQHGSHAHAASCHSLVLSFACNGSA